MKIKIGDKVRVIAGKHKGQEGQVIKTFKKQERVIVEKLNIVKKHIKPSQSQPDGGIVEKEASMHVSNVALISETKVKAKKPVAKKAKPKAEVKTEAKNEKTTEKKVAKKATDKK